MKITITPPNKKKPAEGITGGTRGSRRLKDGRLIITGQAKTKKTPDNIITKGKIKSDLINNWRELGNEAATTNNQERLNQLVHSSDWRIRGEAASNPLITKEHTEFLTSGDEKKQTWVAHCLLDNESIEFSDIAKERLLNHSDSEIRYLAQRRFN